MKTLVKNYWFYIVAITLPWMIAIIKCAVSGLWIFGEGDMLRGDMSGQLVPFYYELWHRIHNGDFSLYMWDVAGGLDALTILGYLLSPFSIIVILCNEANIADAVQFIMIAKWSVVSYSMVFFFYHTQFNTMEKCKKLASLFLGCAYVFSNSMINYIGYIQFDDVFIYFPFLLLLLENMVRTGRWKLYYILLSLSMISSVFMSYNVCIMLLFWFVLLIITDNSNLKKKILVFIGSSILAALNAIAMVIPGMGTFGNRIIQADGVKDVQYFKHLLITPVVFLKQLFFYNDIVQASDITPNLYFSVACAVLILFFALIKIDVKQKIYLICVACFMTASFFMGVLSIIWHCFVVPNNVYHRFSNFYIFLMLVIVLYVMLHIDQIRCLQVVLVGSISLIVFAVTFFSITIYTSVISYLFTILLIVFYCIMLYLHASKSLSYKTVVGLICIVGIAELSVNGYHAFKDYDFLNGFDNKYKNLISISEDIQLNEGERYVCPRCINSGMILSKSSEDGFVSGINNNNLMLLKKLGMPYNGKVEYCISGASPIINLMYNISYVAGLDEHIMSDADHIREEGVYNLYKVKRIAGLGYMVDSDIMSWDITEGTCFDIQNEYVKNAVGTEDVFEKIYPEVYTHNVNEDLILADENALQGGVYSYDYKHIGSGLNDFISSDIMVDEDMDMYIFIMCDNPAYLEVLLDDEVKHTDQVVFQQQTLHIGNVKEGQRIRINMYEPYTVAGNEERVMLYFAKFNEAAYDKAYDILSKNVMSIKGEVSDVVNGSIVADKKGIMMTSIQASDNWKVYVDGSQVEYETIGGALIGVPLDKGEHDIKFVYYPLRLFMGFYIALGGWMIFAGICINSVFKKRKADRVTNGSILR